MADRTWNGRCLPARMRARMILASFLGLVGCGRIADVPSDEPRLDGGPAAGGSSVIGGPSSSDTAPRDAGSTTVDAGVKGSAGRCATDADCGVDGRCVELAPGGYRVCSHPPPPPEECTDAGSLPDECCGTCSGGTCTLVTSCGGAFINPHNECVAPACTTNADCGANGICLPSGVGSPYGRTCMTMNECIRHADCVAAPGGVCALLGMTGPRPKCGPWTCPGGASTELAYGLACIYGSDCAGDQDCPNGHCETSGGHLTCMPGLRAACPPPP